MGYLYVFVGGGLGSIARYLMSIWCGVGGFSWGTLLANIISCLILGVLLNYHQEMILSSPKRLLLMTGFCGGFSTFSTFSGEIISLLYANQFLTAITYMLVSLITGLLAILAGMWLYESIS